LKSNAYDKVSTKLAPNFLLKFLAMFLSDLKGMLPFIGNEFNGDVNETMKIFNWKPMPLEKTVLDIAKSLEEAMKK
jgi:dihydroflavonol-4-reductase